MSAPHASQSVNPVAGYLKIYVALMVLLAATVGVAFLNLGPWNIIVALMIATVKAILVILFFMHVKASEKLIWLFAGVGFLWTLYLFGGVFGDVFTRN